ncbi:MAG TPA: uroporphyrinogen-III C-methyltransferase [Myxococcales bacterium]|jgi:uroporphyrin-III C-methyltransferase/precorrin-2 dehydrogenase/sirohydrochlorin ferrochelatase|nr:uroporphyrinogen-III C-methyltransferase [Myxococcales bacterium]
MSRRGYVSLVGAGPGDPELLTLRAAARLREADLVLYDALAGREALGLAPRARWFYVGKRARRRSIAQESIERLMIRAALRGERVVRLKCGDPFVLGRGGEEALALARAGIPYEVVPGVTSAVAAPALAGIPVTHRGLSTGFAVVSGHAEPAYAPLLSSLAPGSATVVVLMGLANRASIAALLLARGWPDTTPAAVLLDASHESAATWTGTLTALRSCTLPDARPESAGVLVIGEVVSLAAAISAIPRERSGAPAVARAVLPAA